MITNMVVPSIIVPDGAVAIRRATITKKNQYRQSESLSEFSLLHDSAQTIFFVSILEKSNEANIRLHRIN